MTLRVRVKTSKVFEILYRNGLNGRYYHGDQLRLRPGDWFEPAAYVNDSPLSRLLLGADSHYEEGPGWLG